MPSYLKFMKEILSKKWNMRDYETVALIEECNAILQMKVPQKLRDSGGFTIPCIIGDFECKHALFDLGASINLKPLSVFRRLGQGEARPTIVTLQLADWSVKHLRGIIEDVFLNPLLVKNRVNNANIPIILGRKFLATRQELINVLKREQKLRVQGEEVVFNVFKAMDYPRASDSCYNIDVVDRIVAGRKVVDDYLELSLTMVDLDEDDGDDAMGYLHWINSYGPLNRKSVMIN
ncbi:uncharacterized protein LOC133825387 [Humulus lupulus]|uniref:uncharacterized protein LOC133825387 n=1 Tax=Humulus lupulus TaxID=3486 RepID=UPI002B4116FB|nr:uncharacterized protein LOC133825387 [Humulus lupulus]